eukprot:scaffold7853_cov168-Skeletonema_marinoi.AAC.1
MTSTRSRSIAIPPKSLNIPLSVVRSVVEAAKQSTLLQLTNGDGVDGAGHLLQLTNGEVLSSVDEATLESSKDSMGSDRKGVYGGGV